MPPGRLSLPPGETSRPTVQADTVYYRSRSRRYVVILGAVTDAENERGIIPQFT